MEAFDSATEADLEQWEEELSEASQSNVKLLEVEQQQIDTTRTAFEAEMRLRGRRAAVSLLAHILARQLLTQQGAGLHSMRMNHDQDKRTNAMLWLQSQNDTMVRSHAIRLMRAALWRTVRGRVSMRLELWRSQQRGTALAKTAAMRARLESEMTVRGKQSAVQQLALVMVLE